MIIPKIEKLLDTDKLQPILSSILSQILLPNLKSAFRYCASSKFIFRFQALGALATIGLRSICVQCTLSKYWKREFWDSVFLDQQFFSCSQETLQDFIVEMKALLHTDSEKISELLGTA
jgi:hypothetical protein